MALVSSAPVIQQRILGTANIMRSGIEIEEEPVTEGDERIFVALGKDVRENKSVLLWALQNNRGKKISILHVHQPAQMIPMSLGGKFPASKLKEQGISAYRLFEKEKMNKMLDEYLIICIKQRVPAEKLCIDMDDIEKGIVELVAQRRINKLVMGAAAEKHLSSCKKMGRPRSKKAIFVAQQADLSCNIWFVCRGTLICTRESSLEGTGRWVALPSPAATPSTSQFRSASLPSGLHMVRNPVEDTLRKSTSDPAGMLRNPSTPTSQQRLVAREETPVRSPSQGSERSMWSASEDGACTSSHSTVRDRDEVRDDGSALPSVHESEEDLLHYQSAENELEMERVDDQLYDQLEEARAEAENSKREAFEESSRRRKAEKDALEAARKAKALENSYKKEMRQRKEAEEALAREIQELDKIKSQNDQVIEELQKAQHQKQELEAQIGDSERTVKQLEEKLAYAQQILSNLQIERGEMERDRDEAIREVEELRRRMDEEVGGSSRRPENFSSFKPWEIEEATNNYAASLKIGEGGYGSVFRGTIRNTPVAIKTLHTDSWQGRSEFLQEVEVLSRVRHPNLVTLIGACPESGALIYELLPNGSLEDRLVCQNGSLPLSWQARTRIATEICSALIFLHSNKPNGVVHGDLKPANILLDANLVSKIGDFGICRTFNQANTISTLYVKTNPKGTFAYMDPEFLSTSELTTKSDVYSFGIIILRLLTGKQAIGIVKEVQEALDSGNLQAVLDESAGKWPFVQARQLAHIALRCCEMNRKNRPDLVSEVWRVLEPMRGSSSAATSSFRLAPDEHSRIPSYFICPIFQEIMQDPHIAADGYTYEAEAVKGWLDSGHDTSPMTNLKLSHRELIPNHALRSVIQEWLQQP